jgi:hypothetical protein
MYPPIVAKQWLGKHVLAAKNNCWRRLFLCGPCRFCELFRVSSGNHVSTIATIALYSSVNGPWAGSTLSHRQSLSPGESALFSYTWLVTDQGGHIVPFSEYGLPVQAETRPFRFVRYSCVLPHSRFKATSIRRYDFSYIYIIQHVFQATVAVAAAWMQHLTKCCTSKSINVPDWKHEGNRPWKPIGSWDVEAHRWRWSCQPYAPTPFTPWYSFLLEVSRPQAHSAAGRIRSIEKSNDLIEEPNPRPSTCSVVSTNCDGNVLTSNYCNL